MNSRVNSIPFSTTSFSFDLDSHYQRRFGIFIIVSAVLNLLFIWILLVSDITKHSWLPDSSPSTLKKKEIPQLLLIKREPDASRRRQTFLETDPNQAVVEAPQDAAHYSERNTAATQTMPSPEKSAEIPKAEGNNTKTMATETVLHSPPPTTTPPIPMENKKVDLSQRPISEPAKSLEPTPHDEHLAKQSPSDLPKAPKVGELTMLRETSSSEEKYTDHKKENSQEASRRDAATRSALPPSPSSTSSREVLASMSKLDGGVNKLGKALAFNSAESPFAAYDKKIIGKIGSYWQYQVVDKFYGEKIGEVEVSFRLLADGRVSSLKVTRNTANAVLAGWCLQAIEQSAPFEPFPGSMQALVGDYREGTITFAY